MSGTTPVGPSRARPARTSRGGSRARSEKHRRDLLDSAAKVFSRRGFQAGTTKEIAELAGLRQSSLYWYFRSKKDLMSEIAHQVSTDFSEALDVALAGDCAPERQLKHIIDAFVGSLVVNQMTFGVYWQEYSSIPPESARKARALELAYIRRVERVVAAAQRGGALPARHDKRILAMGILGMMSWMHRWYLPDRHTPQQVAAAFCDLLGVGAGRRYSLSDKEDGEHREKRRKLLDSAAQVFFSRGFQAGTTEEIASRAGMSQSNFYHYYDSKEQIMGEIADRMSTEFTQALDKVLPPSAGQKLRNIIEAFVNSLVNSQVDFAVYWQEYRSIPPESARKARALELTFIERVERVVVEGQREGVLPAQHDENILCEAILGMMSWMPRWYRRDQYTPPQVVEAFCDLIGLESV
ncbi:TetR/AcrR family transcriptional regulator [Streptomyces sp. NPDC059679]|uniref:TetR/AcrR family transcriptional regulator n=1 Tax=Streptomyces sp. NPDC059679 TaxID=3346903 RepID=UPI0036AE3702